MYRAEISPYSSKPYIQNIHLLSYAKPAFENLIKVRHNRSQVMLAKKIEIEKLPLKYQAALLHSLRFHHHIYNQLMKISFYSLGWRNSEKGFEPITTYLHEASDSILRQIPWNCKAEITRCAANSCNFASMSIHTLQTMGAAMVRTSSMVNPLIQEYIEQW